MGAKTLFCLLVVAAVVGFVACPPPNPPNYPTKPIELKYYATGPWAVTVEIGHYCCDSATPSHKFDVYYPTTLGAHGFMHPILTWGNGTLGSTQQVDFFLRHMASWGFVVIATEDQFTGPGQTVLDAANFMVHANSDPASPFFHKLNVTQIGAFGHSQGAGGAENAFFKSAGLIKTLMPIELPAQVWCASNCFDPANLSGGSVFFIDGSADIPISPPTQSQPVAAIGEQSVQAFYDATPNSVRKVKGTLLGPTHNDITGQPDCSHAQFPCINGVYGYLGYPTAWFMDQLQGDTYAHGAFVNGSGEMFSETTNWEYVASNIP
jgi:hypothetical protein